MERRKVVSYRQLPTRGPAGIIEREWEWLFLGLREWGCDMEKRKVVNYRQLPTKVPSVIWTGIVMWLFLDRLKVQDWIWGAVSVVWVIILVAVVAVSSSEVQSNVRFRDDE